jgi:uncharacterized protein YegJ (DUF2314 family)
MTSSDNGSVEPLFATLSDDDEALIRSVAKARETLPHFKAAFSKPEFKAASFMIKAPFLDRSDAGEKALVRTADVAAAYPTLPVAHLWLSLSSVLEDLLFCSVFEAPRQLRLKSGDSFVIKEQFIEDWMINDQGEVYGGFSLRVIRNALAERDKDAFDAHTGIRAFREEVP